MKYFLLVSSFFFLIACSQSAQVPVIEEDVEKSSKLTLEEPEEWILAEESTQKRESSSESDLTEAIPKENCLVFEDFTEVSQYRWGIVNDWVMWGKSRGFLSYEDESMIFSGMIVTRWWGFSSLRGALSPWVLSDYSSVKLRAKSDGREYKMTFRDSNNQSISHQAVIPFQNPWEFEEVTILFDTLDPSYFGRPTKVAAFNKDLAQQIGVILSDGVDWEFRLEIEEVRFCK